MNYTAINNSIVVNVEQKEKITERDSGLFVITGKKDFNSVVGTVVSTSKRYNKFGNEIPVELKIGDKILVNLTTGLKLDENHIVLKYDDIFAIVN